ncbi:GSCOCG00003470001-RA-CDS [Cotesia congregata]|nr:GSCOCG00003470001-RA-CDS [Cotesia congregata]
MGSSQSARKLTIDNEEGIIQISTDLVERLARNSKDKSVSADAAGDSSPKAAPSVIPPVPAPVTPMRSLPTRKESLPKSEYSGQLYSDYTLTAMKVLHQKEDELQAQDHYWRERLQKIHGQYEKINRVFQDEYNRAKEQIANAPGKILCNKNVNIDITVAPCSDKKKKVLECYQENPRQILKCASVVEEFSSCVDKCRANIIAARC